MRWDDWKDQRDFPDGLVWETVPDTELPPDVRDRLDAQIRGLFAPVSVEAPVVSSIERTGPAARAVNQNLRRPRSSRRTVVAAAACAVLATLAALSALLVDKANSAVSAIDTSPLPTTDPASTGDSYAVLGWVLIGLTTTAILIVLVFAVRRRLHERRASEIDRPL